MKGFSEDHQKQLHSALRLVLLNKDTKCKSEPFEEERDNQPYLWSEDKEKKKNNTEKEEEAENKTAEKEETKIKKKNL